MVKTLPRNAGNVGPSPGGRPEIPHTGGQLLGPRTTARAGTPRQEIPQDATGTRGSQRVPSGRLKTKVYLLWLQKEPPRALTEATRAAKLKAPPGAHRAHVTAVHSARLYLLRQEARAPDAPGPDSQFLGRLRRSPWCLSRKRGREFSRRREGQTSFFFLCIP